MNDSVANHCGAFPCGHSLGSRGLFIPLTGGLILWGSGTQRHLQLPQALGCPRHRRHRRNQPCGGLRLSVVGGAGARGPSQCLLGGNDGNAILENSFSSPSYWHGSKTTHPPAEPCDR